MDYLTITLIAIAVLTTGISKGGFSGAFGVIAVPLIALTMSPVQAAAIMLPILCIMDLFTIQKFWKKWDGRIIRIAIPAAIVGITIGGLSASWLSIAWLKILIGVIAIGFALNAFTKHIRREQLTPLSPLAARFWCALGGFTSFVAHAGGPPMNVFLLRTGVDKTTFVATAALIFTAINYVKLIPYGLLGQLNLDVIWLSLAFTPVAFIGVQLGAWLHYRVSGDLFFRVIYTLLAITGVKLLWDGVALF
ncbi:sulfite exporter TauE/SafE family protein [Maribrevibacterium harenarium]|uniref:Probable membrane transporter protein n=1 Tax=Maribrevibacterium harenarium TaxID=2589817 RepID=A0A501WRM5_9GAMM|nr:sulfite exporter TauE/SafE family protein [Maribrevibacterium harenarium]TPE52008.1 sulfite exporter TauE/SafE family protein [Maribrevibacterium harenarium]